MKSINSLDKKYGGFSLVELLVSLLIASIIFGGVVQVALSGKRSAMDGEEVSFIQDNARFVLDQIKRDTRAAGYLGCAGLDNSYTVNAVQDDLDGFISMLQGIEGYEADAGINTFPDSYKADVEAGTDSFIVRFADASSEYKVKGHDAGAGEFTLWSAEEIPQGSTMLVADSSCRAAGLFQVTSSGSSSTKVNHASDGTRNCTNVLKTEEAVLDCSVCSGSTCSGSSGPVSGSAYLNGASLMPFRVYAYYVGQSDIIPNMPALKRRALTIDGGIASTEVEEIAHGVEGLQLSYGVDLNGDGVANRFVDADDVSDWNQVMSLRMTAVFRSSVEVYSSDQNLTLNVDGSSVAIANDKYLRQVVSTSVRFRNL